MKNKSEITTVTNVKTTEAVALQTYVLPELGISVKAESVDDAIAKAKKTKEIK